MKLKKREIPRHAACLGMTVICVFALVAQTIRKLGSAFKSIEAVWPASKWGYAAAAIMAALSVESARLGKNTVTPIGVDLDWKVSRNSELAATPPDTKIARAPVSVAAASVRVTRSLTTAD